MTAIWTGLVAAVAMAASLATAGTVTYYHNDLAGSPVVATNAAGQVIWRESYRPYGERTVNSAAALDNRVWFTSRRQDPETGLVYMGARYYDPVVGRFVSTDPVLFDEKNLHSFNRYAYANNNPYRFLDPDGRLPAHAARLVGQSSFALATRFGARELGERLAAALWVLTSTSGDTEGGGNKAGADASLTASVASSAGGAPDPNDSGDRGSQREVKLKRVHSDETIKSSNRSSYDYWSSKSNDEIVKSLRPGQEEPLTAKPDGRIFQGNTRALILEERGVNINSLPREVIP